MYIDQNGEKCNIVSHLGRARSSRGISMLPACRAALLEHCAFRHIPFSPAAWAASCSRCCSRHFYSTLFAVVLKGVDRFRALLFEACLVRSGFHDDTRRAACCSSRLVLCFMCYLIVIRYVAWFCSIFNVC